MNYNKGVDNSLTEHNTMYPSHINRLRCTGANLSETNIQTLSNANPVLCKHLHMLIFNTEIINDPDNNFSQGRPGCQCSPGTVQRLRKANDTKDNKTVNNIQTYKKYFEKYVKMYNFEHVMHMFSFSFYPEKYIDLFIENHNIKNMFNQDVDIDQNYDISRRYNIDSIISISKYDFLSQTLSSYPDDMAIMKQFLVDVTRQDIFVNNVNVTSIDELIIAIGTHNTKIQINSKDRPAISVIMCTLMLACQSSFCVSFTHLHNKCAKLHSVICDNESVKPNIRANYVDPRKDYHVFSLREKGKISFSIGPNKLQCSFFAKYRVVDVITNQDIYIVNSETLIDIDKDMGIIVYETL